MTTTGRVRVFERGTLVADVPARALTDEGPVYRRPTTEPEWQRRLQQLPFETLGAPVAPAQAFEALIAAPVEALRAGQLCRFTVRVKAPHGALNPHGFDFELWLLEQGIRLAEKEQTSLDEVMRVAYFE